MTRPLLVFGWGNASRGDDGLGPLFIERLRAKVGDADVEFQEDYQLQVEHALDLTGRERVLFVDASVTCAAPFEVTVLRPSRDASFSTHAMSPEAVMQVFRDIHLVEPPECTLLAIRGDAFELGVVPSASATANLEPALEWGMRWVRGDAASAPLLDAADSAIRY